MFRDSLSFAPPYVLLEQFGAFYHPEKRGQQAAGLPPHPTPTPRFSSCADEPLALPQE